MTELIVQTDRLLLRYQDAADTDSLLQLWTDPEVTRFLGGPREPVRLRANLDESAGEREPYDLWPLVERETAQVVGHCGLLDKEVDGGNEVEVVYVLATSVWGRGYATEIAGALVRHAFEERGLARVIALIEPENAASERVAQKIGMRLETETVRPGGAVRRLYALER